MRVSENRFYLFKFAFVPVSESKECRGGDEKTTDRITTAPLTSNQLSPHTYTPRPRLVVIIIFVF